MPEDSSTSDEGGRQVDNDLLPVRVNRGIMAIKRMNELLMRYGVPSRYVCRLPTTGEYVSILGTLEIGVCEESF